jgi:hypothetical protein
MKTLSKETLGLRAAAARAALAVFAFVALTAWQLQAERQLGDQARAQVALLAEPGSPSLDGDTSCRT